MRAFTKLASPQVHAFIKLALPQVRSPSLPHHKRVRSSSLPPSLPHHKCVHRACLTTSACVHQACLTTSAFTKLASPQVCSYKALACIIIAIVSLNIINCVPVFNNTHFDILCRLTRVFLVLCVSPSSKGSSGAPGRGHSVTNVSYTEPGHQSTVIPTIFVQ